MMTKLAGNSYFIDFKFDEPIKNFEIQKDEIQSAKNFINDDLQDDFVYDHNHCEWIEVYRSMDINQAVDFEKVLENITLNYYENSLNKNILKIVQDLKDAYTTYLDEIESYIEPAQPSIDSYKSLLKYASFLSDYNSKFYIDAKTGNFGCTIKKRLNERRKKSIDLVFKSNYEIIFCWTKNMNNLIHIRGIADFDDDLHDARAIRNLINLY